MANAIQVEGLADLRRAFAAADKALANDLDDALMEAAAPVRSDAQALAMTITNMRPTSEWTHMRIGIERRGSISFVAPTARGQKGRNQRLRRPKFKDVLGPKMDLALVKNRDRVEKRLDQLLAEVKAVWERYG